MKIFRRAIQREIAGCRRLLSVLEGNGKALKAAQITASINSAISSPLANDDKTRQRLIHHLIKHLRAMESSTILSYRNIIRNTNFICFFLGKTKLRPTWDGKTDNSVFKRLKKQYFKNLRTVYEHSGPKELHKSYCLV